jgi:hypothetical protein
MTPQEKAIELVDKFKYISYYLDDIQNHKEGALIAVDEIILSHQMSVSCEDLVVDYWKEVKQEIEKL